MFATCVRPRGVEEGSDNSRPPTTACPAPARLHFRLLQNRSVSSGLEVNDDCTKDAGRGRAVSCVLLVSSGNPATGHRCAIASGCRLHAASHSKTHPSRPRPSTGRFRKSSFRISDRLQRTAGEEYRDWQDQERRYREEGRSCKPLASSFPHWRQIRTKWCSAKRFSSTGQHASWRTSTSRSSSALGLLGAQSVQPSDLR